jgi:hypothetical protein
MNQRRNQTTAENRNARRIAFVQACWHKDIVDRCRASFTAGNRQARVRRTATLAPFGLAPQLSFVTFPPNSGPLPIWGGTELRPGEIVLYGRGERMHQSTPGSFVWNVIALNRLRLEQ